MLSIDDVLIGGRRCIGLISLICLIGLILLFIMAVGPNRANAFVITADEFNKPNYLLVEINGLDRANLVISDRSLLESFK